MEYRSFGCTGLKVSPLCLGAMMFGSWGNRDHDECLRIVHRALDAGINFVEARIDELAPPGTSAL
jgi:aryl-alcohol dehydrogenase-like predicted oxidoreductase